MLLEGSGGRRAERVVLVLRAAFVVVDGSLGGRVILVTRRTVRCRG